MHAQGREAIGAGDQCPDARQRQEEAEQAQAELNTKAEAAAAKAKAARDKAVEAAEIAGVELQDLEPLVADAMPRRGLARKADGTPPNKTQRNLTDPDSHL